MTWVQFSTAFLMGYAAAKLHEHVERFVKVEAKEAAERAAKFYFDRRLQRSIKTAAARHRKEGEGAPEARD